MEELKILGQWIAFGVAHCALVAAFGLYGSDEIVSPGNGAIAIGAALFLGYVWCLLSILLLGFARLGPRAKVAARELTGAHWWLLVVHVWAPSLVGLGARAVFALDGAPGSPIQVSAPYQRGSEFAWGFALLGSCLAYLLGGATLVYLAARRRGLALRALRTATVVA
jgi:hypothetical protein